MTKQRSEAIDACNRILRANANLQIIAAEIKRGCDELRSLWPEADPNRLGRKIATATSEGIVHPMTQTPCTHDITEREIAVSVDGYCPLCQAVEIGRLRTEVELWKSRYEAEREDHEATIKHADKMLNQI